MNLDIALRELERLANHELQHGHTRPLEAIAWTRNYGHLVVQTIKRLQNAETKVKEVKAKLVKRAIYEIDKELENGSPVETWDAIELAVDSARERAIEAVKGILA